MRQLIRRSMRWRTAKLSSLGKSRQAGYMTQMIATPPACCRRTLLTAVTLIGATSAGLLLSGCAGSHDGIEPPAGAPTARLVFAQGVMQPAIAGMKPVSVLRINGKRPALTRWDHNVFRVAPGPVKLVIQGLGPGSNGLAAITEVSFEARAGQEYRFGHQPGPGGATLFFIIDGNGQKVGSGEATMRPGAAQGPLSGWTPVSAQATF